MRFKGAADFRCCAGVWLCASRGFFAVEPGAHHCSDKDFHQSHRKADGHNMSGEKMERNRADRGKQVPETPDGCTGTERRFCPGAVARAYRGIVMMDG